MEFLFVIFEGQQGWFLNIFDRGWGRFWGPVGYWRRVHIIGRVGRDGALGPGAATASTRRGASLPTLQSQHGGLSRGTEREMSFTFTTFKCAFFSKTLSLWSLSNVQILQTDAKTGASLPTLHSQPGGSWQDAGTKEKQIGHNIPQHVGATDGTSINQQKRSFSHWMKWLRATIGINDFPMVLVTMVFDGCAPLVRRWNGNVPSSKSTPK